MTHGITKLLKVCLRIRYVQMDGKFFQQKGGMAMESCLPSLTTSTWSILRNRLLTWHNTTHRCDMSVVWLHGPERLQNFLSHFNNFRPSIQFTVEIVSAIPFLDLLVIRKEMTLTTKIYREPSHTGRYLNFKSNHPPHVKRGLIQFSQ
jgi:hypothetical protein